jgi:hypothetical protein
VGIRMSEWSTRDMSHLFLFTNFSRVWTNGKASTAFHSHFEREIHNHEIDYKMGKKKKTEFSGTLLVRSSIAVSLVL